VQEINLLPKQDDFIFSSKKYTGFIGGIGSGKTFAGCAKAVIEVFDGRDGMIVAPTFPMLRDVTQRTFFEILRESGVAYNFNKTEGVCKTSNCTILFRSAEHPDRLRGPNLSWVYLDEAAQMRPLVWDVVIGRLRIGEPKAWITTTPAGFNWVYDYFVERSDPNYLMIQAKTKENVHLPGDYVEDLGNAYTGEFSKQELDGEFVRFEGLVYSEFYRQTHIIKPFEIPDSWQRYRAVDYGYTNPFVCLWGVVDEDGRLYIYREHYQSQRLIKEHANEITKHDDKIQWTVADHDAQDNAEMRSCGINTVNAKKDVITGIQKVKSRLEVKGDGKPRLYVFNNCRNLIKEFESYQWQESKDNRGEKEEPMKVNDHAMDALRYLVMQIDRGAIRMTNLAGELGI